MRGAVAATIIYLSAVGVSVAQEVRPAPASENTSMRILEEVVVTAERRSEDLKTLPNAISVFTGGALASSGVTDVASLTQIAPSVIYGESAGNTHLTIRGVGTEVGNIGGEAGVSVSLDGVPLASELMFRRDFLDIASVEVLRGPQGTVSGRNSPGGAVNIHSNRPSAEPDSEVSIGYGNFNRAKTSGFVSGPIGGDTLLGRLAVSYVKDDGWLRNTFLDHRANSQEYLHGRGYLTFQPSEAFNVSLILDAFSDKGFELAGVDIGRVRPDVPSLSQYIFGHPSFDIDDLTFQEDNPGPFNGKGQQATLRAEWSWGASGKLTSLTGFQDFFRSGYRDYDATPAPQSVSHLEINLQQLSQEFTYVADLGDRADIVVGGLFLSQHASEPFIVGQPFFAGLPFGAIQLYPSQTLKSFGAYSQLRYKISDQLRLTLGLRQTRDEKEYRQHSLVVGNASSVNASGDWSALTPRLALDYTPSDSVTFYTNVARGFAAGGINTYTLPIDPFTPTYVWNYEAGLKSFLLDRRVKLNLAAFYEDYKDIQTTVFRLSTALTGTISVENAGGARIRGLEAEVEANVGERLQLSASATALDARFTELITADSVYPELGTQNLAGNSLQRSPDWQFNLGAEYAAPLSPSWTLTLRSNYAWQDRVFFNFYNHPLLSQGAYGLLNVSAALGSTDGKWRAVAFANNATDKRYWSNGQVGTGTPVPYTNGMIGEPRTYGMQISRRF